MTRTQKPSYEELRRRLEAAESRLQAIQSAPSDASSRDRPSLVDRLADAEAREDHSKQVLLAIRNVNQLIAKAHDRDRLLRGACDLLTETRGYHSAWIVQVDDQGSPSTAVEAGLAEAFSPLRTLLDGGDLPPCMQRALTNPGDVVVPDLTRGCRYCPIEADPADLGGLTVALVHEGTVSGLLCVTLPIPLVKDPEEQALLQEIAGDLAFGLHTLEVEEARSQAVRELEESEAMLRMIVENAFDGISIHEEIPGTRSRRLIDCNDRYAEMAGRSKAELLEAGNTSRFQKKLDRPRSTDENQKLRAGKIPYRGIFSWIRPDHKENVIEYTAVPVEAGERPLTVGIDRDVTEKVRAMAEREEALEALAESQRQLSTLMRNLPGMAYRCLNEPSWPMVFVSEGCREITGYTPAELTDVDRAVYGELIHPADRQRVWDLIQEAVEAGESFVLEYRLRDKEGEERWVWERGRVVAGKNGDPIYLEGFISDVTEHKAFEHALQESEEKYRTLFKEALTPIMLVDQEGRYVDANRAALEFLECERNELLGKNVWAFSPPGRIEQQQQEHAPFAERRTLETDYWVRDSVKTLLLNVVPLEMDGKTILYGIGQDITERKRIEAQRKEALEAMRESEARYRTLFESAQDAILIMERETFVECNEATVRMYGGESKRDILGHTPMEFSLPTQPGGRNSEREALSHIRAALKGQAQHFEWKHTKKDGTPFDTEVSLNRLQLDGKTYLQAIVRDVTERKQAERERMRLADQIREQARQMAQVLETVPAGVLLLDDQEQVVEANPVAERALTVLTEARIGDTLTHLGDHSLHELLTSPPTRGLWHEVNTETPSGERTFEIIAKPVANGPEPEQWVLVINEVTQEREIRTQLRRQEQLAAVGQLAAGIAHDFNNIMAVIVLYTQMGLRAPDLSPRLRERLNVIDQQAKRATTLIQQILDFGGRAMLERRPMDLVPFLKETVKLLQRTIPEHVTISLTFGIDTYTVDADPTRLQQMLTNLVVNARDAMPDGGALRIELHKLRLAPDETPPLPEMEPGSWVQLTVADTGTGMPDEVLAHLFEPFYTTKEPGTGTGLGLAQVHGIVSQHDGAINVETEAGVGTTFTIYLPALDTPAIEPSPPEIQPPSPGQGEVVLVVEDETTVRAALVESLEAWHYRTMEAANGEEALAAIDAHGNEIDLIISDVVMPVMGGIALFHALRERGSAIPVVMLSGHPLESQLRDLQAEGLTGWMLKPPDMGHLSQLLNRALHES